MRGVSEVVYGFLRGSVVNSHPLVPQLPGSFSGPLVILCRQSSLGCSLCVDFCCCAISLVQCLATWLLRWCCLAIACLQVMSFTGSGAAGVSDSLLLWSDFVLEVFGLSPSLDLVVEAMCTTKVLQSAIL
ncbi:hypothetical protein DY000_02035407 [Brassica cretica]|uniref:Uncharacterized protein n=1 Tax=Brassica cretica TaxID=69181 RepID=A0ABQ7DQL3_BRACR|nr:hypothetical protein DY000_02035407 [Brassica cretica]